MKEPSVPNAGAPDAATSRDYVQMWCAGDRVAVRPSSRGKWVTAEVINSDAGGLHLALDEPVNGILTAYASKQEVRRPTDEEASAGDYCRMIGLNLPMSERLARAQAAAAGAPVVKRTYQQIDPSAVSTGYQQAAGGRDE